MRPLVPQSFSPCEFASTQLLCILRHGVGMFFFSEARSWEEHHYLEKTSPCKLKGGSKQNGVGFFSVRPCVKGSLVLKVSERGSSLLWLVQV